MPIKDQYHDIVIRTLRKDGWIVTKEQAYISIGITDERKRRLFIDIEAMRDVDQLILVEVKRLAPSPVHQLMQLLGQYYVYRTALDHIENPTPLYVAVTQQEYENIFQETLGQIVMEKHPIPLLIYNATNEEVVRWIPQP